MVKAKKREPVEQYVQKVIDVLLRKDVANRAGITQLEIARLICGEAVEDFVCEPWVDIISKGHINRRIRSLMQKQFGKMVLPINVRIERIPSWKKEHIVGEEGMSNLLHSLQFDKKLKARSEGLDTKAKLEFAAENLFFEAGYHSHSYGYLIGNGPCFVMDRWLSKFANVATKHGNGHADTIYAAVNGTVISMERGKALLTGMKIVPQLKKAEG